MRSLLLTLLLIPLLGATAVAEATELPVLCFHDVRDAGAELTELTVSSDQLLAQFSWLHGAGYKPVSVDDVLAARRGERRLPHKALLLTFDDGYADFYTRVYPLLRLFEYPAVLSLVGSWMETPPGETVSYGGQDVPREAFLSWEQVREMVDSGLVEIASHSYDLHYGDAGNPRGNRQPAAATRIHDPATGRYENDDVYRRRLTDDLRRNIELIERRTGRRPRIIAWPFGAPAPVPAPLADELDLEVELLLERRHHGESPLLSMSRRLVPPAASLQTFAGLLRTPVFEWSRRAVRVELDGIYDADPDRREKKLGELLDRVKDLGVSTVYLEAFADADADGAAEAVYFPSDQLPMRADLFNRAAWQLKTRSGVEVYAILPLRGDPGRLANIYADLARHAHFQGLIFDPEVRLAGTGSTAPLADKKQLAARARAFRPRLQSVDLLSAEALDQASEADWTILRLDGRKLMEQPQRAARLVETVAAKPRDLERTVFFIECETAPVDREAADALFVALRSLQAGGARHFGYGPDDYARNAPPLETIAPAISQREYPDEL